LSFLLEADWVPVLVAEGDGNSGLLPCPVDGGGQAGGGDNKEEVVGGPARGGREVGEGELASTMDGNLMNHILSKSCEVILPSCSASSGLLLAARPGSGQVMPTFPPPRRSTRGWRLRLEGRRFLLESSASPGPPSFFLSFADGSRLPLGPLVLALFRLCSRSFSVSHIVVSWFPVVSLEDYFNLFLFNDFSLFLFSYIPVDLASTSFCNI